MFCVFCKYVCSLWVPMCTFLSTYEVLSGHVDMLACIVNKLPNFLGITYPSAAFGLPSQSHMLSRTHVLVAASLGVPWGFSTQVALPISKPHIRGYAN